MNLFNDISMEKSRSAAEYCDGIFFTIVAKNYLPYAKVLHSSLLHHMPKSRFFAAICDDISDLDQDALSFPILSLNDFSEDRLLEMGDRYNITEFCTSIKPFVFRHLINEYPNKNIIYLDPDILITSPFEEMFEALNAGANLVLTPHVLFGSEHTQAPDSTMLKYGIYNLGFLAVYANQPVDKLMQWWCDRLEHECVINLPEGLFVDQKWADLFPAFIDNVHILRHAGYNLAYWNLLQRPTTFENNRWIVDGAPLRFVHFSGNEISRPAVFSRHAPYIDYQHIGDIRILYEYYRSLVIEAGYFELARQRYAFNFSGSTGVNLHTPDNTADRLLQDDYNVARHLVPFTTLGRAIESPVPSERGVELYTRTLLSWNDYLDILNTDHAIFAQHRAAEAEIEQQGSEWFDHLATCAMCRNVTPMRVSYMYAHVTNDGRTIPNWREHLNCKCGFINRIRAAIHYAQTDINPADDEEIYITEQVTDLFKYLRQRHHNLIGSEFLNKDMASGEISGAIRHEDVCKLSFPDDSFGLIMSFDVLEHVENLEAALAEVFRCLKEGGTFLFAAPTQFSSPDIIDRVLVKEDGSYEYIMEPEYHGNPVNMEDGALCFRYLGLDVLDLLRRVGFREAKAILYWSKDYGYLGTNQIFFVAGK